MSAKLSRARGRSDTRGEHNVPKSLFVKLSYEEKGQRLSLHWQMQFCLWRRLQWKIVWNLNRITLRSNLVKLTLKKASLEAEQCVMVMLSWQKTTFWTCTIE